MKNSASNSERIRRAHFANVRQDLLGPVTAILGYAELLEEEARRRELSDVLSDTGRILTSARSLLALVDKLLEVDWAPEAHADVDLVATQSSLRHDLRNPLNVIKGYGEILLEDMEDLGCEALRPDLETMLTEVERLLSQIDLIVDFTRLDRSGAKSPEDEGEMPSMVADLVDSIRPVGESDLRPTETGAILVVDDNESNRNLLSRRLSREGHQVTVTDSGRGALEILQSEAFDLILLDLIMPEMNGFEVLGHLKNDDNLRNIPVIVISGLQETDGVIRCIEAGAEDYLPKPFDPVLLRARINASLERKRWRDRERGYLAFIRNAFGRYISHEVVEELLRSPEGLELGGKLHEVTFLVSDLRGFTSMSSRLAPHDVLEVINGYFGRMVDIITRYQGTVDKFQGDGILAFFGAPLSADDDPERAVACAVEMQAAMVEVNAEQRRHDFPELTMGIGIDTGEAVVGNIGSETRTNYSAIGTPINTAHRIESYTTGGQILISPSTFERVRDLVEVRDTLRVQFKGLDQPISVYDIIGLSGKYACSLPDRAQEHPVTLVPPLAVDCYPVKDKTISDDPVPGHILRLTRAAAEVKLKGRVGMHSTLKIRFSEPEATGLSDGYAKVLPLDPSKESPSSHRVRLSFTSLPEDTKAYLDQKRRDLA